MFNLKKYFKKPEIEFNKPLTSDDVVRMFKEKNFYQLRKLMPQIPFGKRKLSRWQSLGVLAMGVLGLAVMPVHPVLGLMAFGLSLSFGSEYVFNSATTYYTSVSALDSTHFVVGYQDGGNANYGTAVIGTISGSSISYSSEYTFSTGPVPYLSIATLDSTHFVMAYRDGSNSNYGTAIVGAVSGTVINFGTPVTYNSVAINGNAVSALDSSHFVVNFWDSNGSAIVGTVSGTSITFGTAQTYNSGNSHTPCITSLDSTHFVVGYQDSGNSNYGTACVGTVSGTSITFGSEYPIHSKRIDYLYVSALDPTHFVAAYADYNDSKHGKATIGTISNGNEISFGAEYLFYSGTAYEEPVVSLDSTHFAIAYRGTGSAIIGTVSGTTIAFGTVVDFNSGSFYLGITSLDSTHFVISYQDSGNSNYGTAIVGTYTPPIVAPTVTTQAVTNIGTETATGNGTITDDGGATATRGMCWATHSTPTISDSHATNGTGEGAYTVQMTGLSPGTHYYVRAYATNSAGTSYGSQVEFDTKTAGNAIFFGANF